MKGDPRSQPWLSQVVSDAHEVISGYPIRGISIKTVSIFLVCLSLPSTVAQAWIPCYFTPLIPRLSRTSPNHPSSLRLFHDYWILGIHHFILYHYTC
jgi:hypothetical protein